jgi:hypothetical protein
MAAMACGTGLWVADAAAGTRATGRSATDLPHPAVTGVPRNRPETRGLDERTARYIRCISRAGKMIVVACYSEKGCSCR